MEFGSFRGYTAEMHKGYAEIRKEYFATNFTNFH